MIPAAICVLGILGYLLRRELATVVKDIWVFMTFQLEESDAREAALSAWFLLSATCVVLWASYFG